MNQNRLAQLKKFLEESPNDPFLIYAIGNELKEFQPKQALEYFEKLLEKFPDYVPTYYHAADLYFFLEMPGEAKATYEKGIAVCQQQGDHHALRELKTAYQNFLFELED